MAPRSSYSEPLPPPGQTMDAPPPTSTPQKSQPGPPTHDHILRAKHVLLGFMALCVGVIGSAMITSMSSNIAFRWALFKVSRRVLQSVAFRNTLGIMALVCLVRYGLEPIARLISRFLNRGAVSWQESNEHFILQQIYRPLELLIITAAISTVGENLLPSLIAIPKDLVRQVIRTSLSLTFVIMSARIVFSIKGKLVGDAARQFEFQGNDPARRRVEAVDKLVTVLVLFVALVLGLQAVGLDINSVLAISGFGGLALGLAGREILENLFNGLLIVSSRSFLVGEEVVFYPGNRMVEGIVVDIGWYRTLIRSFEREIFVIPNSVFSRTVVLNVTRKNKEWRFKESIGLEVADVDKAAAIVADMRKVVRQDPRVLQKLHRRVFLDDISRDEVRIFMSFYVDAANRDAFMAIKQDLLLAFISIVQRNGASLARNYLQLKVTDMPESLSQSLARGANGQQRSSFPTGGGGSGSSQGGGGSASGDGSPPAVLVTKVVENQADSTVEVSTTSTAVAAMAAARPAAASPLHSAPTSVTPSDPLPAHTAAAGGPDRRVRMQGSPQDAADSAAAAPPMGMGGGGAWGASTLTQQEPGVPPQLRGVGDVDA